MEISAKRFSGLDDVAGGFNAHSDVSRCASNAFEHRGERSTCACAKCGN
jgi:hypothetical protein